MPSDLVGAKVSRTHTVRRRTKANVSNSSAHIHISHQNPIAPRIQVLPQPASAASQDVNDTQHRDLDDIYRQSMSDRNRSDIRLCEYSGRIFRSHLSSVQHATNYYEDDETLPSSSVSLEHYITYKSVGSRRNAKTQRPRDASIPATESRVPTPRQSITDSSRYSSHTTFTSDDGPSSSEYCREPSDTPQLYESQAVNTSPQLARAHALATLITQSERTYATPPSTRTPASSHKPVSCFIII